MLPRHPRLRRRALPLISLMLLGLLALSGCGQKGPLYLPSEPAPAPAAREPADPSQTDSSATPPAAQQPAAPAKDDPHAA